MGATSIQDAKVLISSAKAPDRGAGLKDLVYILKHNRGKPALESLGNKAYLALCETLLQCMHNERNAWLKSRAKTAKTAPHLALSANALRHVIYSGVRAIKGSTVEYIVSTIIESLPAKDGTLITPLLEDLPKTLRALLEYQPHVERFSSDCWDATVDFCVESLAGIFTKPDLEEPASWSTGMSSRGRTPFDSTDVVVRSSQRVPSSNQANVSYELIHVAEDLVHCLHLLVKASNAPLLPKAELILHSLVLYLHQKTSRGKATALAAINSIFPRITLNSLSLARHVVLEVLPLMKTLWADLIMRDEILVALTYFEVHIASILQDSPDKSSDMGIEAFLEVVYGDYRRRQETTAHQYLEDDHVCFRRIGRASKEAHPLSTQAFALDPKYSRYEGLWATVACIARLSFMLDEHKRRLAQRDKDEEAMPKRPRITHHFQEYFRHLSEPRSNAKRAALQVIAFIVQEGPLNEEEIRSLLEKLIPCISDENPAHSSWALISLAATVFQRASSSIKLSNIWLSAWKTASRVITSSSSSRSACHFMDVALRRRIVPFSAVSETVQTMLASIELNGPVLLTESTTSLMTTLIQEKVTENPTHYNQTAERVLNWLLNKWTPSMWSERSYAALNAHHCNARDILLVIHACLDRPFLRFRPPPYKIMGSIAQARMHIDTFHGFSQYLLLLDHTDGFSSHASETASPTNTSPSSHVVQLEGRILDFCLSELDKTKKRWAQWSEQYPQNITSDMLRIIVNLCVVSSAFGALVKQQDQRIDDLDTVTDTFARSFVQLLTKPQTERYKIDAVLETCAQNLQDIGDLKDLSRATFKECGMLFLANHLSGALNERKDIKQSFYAEEDFMELDDGPNSQATAGASDFEIDIPRHDISASSEAGAFYSCCSSYLQLIKFAGDMFDQEPDCIPPEFIEYLTSIPEADLLRSRQFTRVLMQGRFNVSQADSMKLLERLSDALIDPRAREYNTSEVANSMILEVLIGTNGIWTIEPSDRETQDLYDHVEALYSYYTKGMEKSGVRRSPGLQTRIATLLHGLLRHHPGFGQSRKVPSVRTSLFELLGKGEMIVKYHIAKQLSDIFEDFVLAEHDKILQDVDDCLPSGEGWLEGIAIRLFVFSKLASRWHTVQRQCIYRMFATAGSIPGATYHAKRCIAEVATARNMGDPQALFRLFASQIIFTWLCRDRKFAEMPFTTFAYGTLEELLRDVEAEAVGQAIMRGQKDDVDYLAKQLGDSTSAVLVRNMPKAAAYTISWDTCNGSARNKSVPSSCSLLRDLVGKDQYAELILQQFPQVLGHIFQTIGHEDRVSKQLDKRPAFHDASKALSEMNNISHSTLALDIEIEPSFSAYYLNDQLERLCRRTGDNPDSFWTSSNYTLVARMLLDRIHPALGPLYARSIIRKLRILVALAGPVAYEGYPLQMTLQSLRPFLTDIQCAEDVVGIMQYLLEHGFQYLEKNLSFVTGIGLSILISIRVFLGSSQESTTQQSQYVATMDTATRFHGWFTRYLRSYADSLADSEDSSNIKAFRLITTAASLVRTEGNSLRGTEESKLLLEILDDVRSGRKLLNNTSREVALNLLCQNFQPAPSARDDVLGSDSKAAEYALHVWDSCRRSNVGDGYLLWAAQVLGRAFSAYGEVRQSTAPVQPWLAHTTTASGNSLGRTSREAIIKEIIGVFYSDDRHEVSLAEESIRLTLSRLPQAQHDYVTELNEIIPRHIIRALGLPITAGRESILSSSTKTLEQCAGMGDDKAVSLWTRDLAISLCRVASHEPLLESLPKLLLGFSHMADRLLPYILHLVLAGEYEGERSVRRTMSEAMTAWFSDCNANRAPHVRIFLQAILYLRSQPVPKEVTRVDRDRWLDIDFMKAARAATICGMYRSALLFAETAAEPTVKVSRRSSTLTEPTKIPIDLQLSIYKNLDEPDSFYGVNRGYSLESVMDRVDYEGDGIKSLLFRGARLDSQNQQARKLQATDTRGMIKSLIMLNMNSVTHSLLSNDQFRNIGEDGVVNTMHTARKLGQWDIKAPEMNHSEQSTLFKAFQGLHYATDRVSAKQSFDNQMLATVRHLVGRYASSPSTQAHLRTLAILTEAHDVVGSRSDDDLIEIWEQLRERESWMRAGEFENVRQILSCRETLFNVLSTNKSLLESLRVRTGSVRNIEVQALVSSSRICRKHGALQESLARVTYLSDIVPECRAVGLEIEATAQHEVASVLWDQGEAETSTGMRQHLIEHTHFDSQDTDISLPVIMAKLGHHLAEARLEKPDGIIRDYLQPAIRELKGQMVGSGPAQVFHEFALFCDKQLQSPEAIEDLQRAKAGVDRRLQEYQDFVKLANSEKSKSMRDTYKRSAAKAKTWYGLDHAEYERQRKGREQFLRQCLENYLQSLQASDEFNNDALRVFSLWLEYSELPLANQAVGLHLSKVPSGKFALLMNQLSSRLQSEQTDFQKLLLELVFRICVDHPYHGMHQIFSIQTKVGNFTREDVIRSKDESARSRQKAAGHIAQLLDRDKRSQATWRAINRSNEIYHALAMFKDEKDNRQGREYSLDRYRESKELVQKIPSLRVPPATLQIEVRANRDYSDLPRIAGFSSRMTIANGLSAPKIITAKGTDGKPYKQLFKSGNDDLRQDAIMEQVFDQVSRLLKNHTATRLRNLGIRTYKVLPLSTRSGLMEFVQDTIPLHMWVMPAHERYYPNDYKPDQCRKQIGAVQHETQSVRIKTWQKVASNFHPVLRYFLLELFQDPDEWFQRRLAYTRSTAAISILGHVLGLGDRHCHNILLDKKSGDVVHIDLGVSFEAGRVLPVPEVVPFRLTRDLVDAMGYTKTEGVFRRCCEFTMDTLREERESIMTLLNVLRYDPLVNWSITSTKAKRMQEGQETAAAAAAAPTSTAVSRAGTVDPIAGTPAPSGVQNLITAQQQQDNNINQESDRKKEEEQAGEAGRALAVVEKKLSKTLSTKATVNELIQAATDERNLAVLYQGWASYA